MLVSSKFSKHRQGLYSIHLVKNNTNRTWPKAVWFILTYCPLLRNIPGPGESSSPSTPPVHRLVVETKAELDI